MDDDDNATGKLPKTASGKPLTAAEEIARVGREYLESPAVKMARELFESPTAKLARDLVNSPAKRATLGLGPAFGAAERMGMTPGEWRRAAHTGE